VSDSAPLREQLAGLPTGPGVYIYRDAADRVLYVGKAKSIRRRVLSYFQAPLRPDGSASSAPMAARNGLHPKTDDLVARIARVEVFVRWRAGR
jgi:excinuclease UvrABC nuclease subunit